ncbi:transposase [Haloferax mediterranei ATCC 33500]|uniref:Transposase n=1 Tax=Haloferax mediterranei (strain ATCC 33500 / DSM 1411 / JCM 8866 / NBRC 14739 / NCIMB 2177 / R-4) TaxID=523841 RepID=M0ILF6_HALMT|nr:transposase [Haloferax mediterranei ATCC 33500]
MRCDGFRRNIQFEQYYNFQRPQQALGGRTPVEEVTN